LAGSIAFRPVARENIMVEGCGREKSCSRNDSQEAEEQAGMGQEQDVLFKDIPQ
jgi:hypothetical protein